MRSPKLSQTNGMMGRFQALKAESLSDHDLERQLGLSTHNPNRMSQTMSVNWLPLLITLTRYFSRRTSRAPAIEIPQ